MFSNNHILTVSLIILLFTLPKSTHAKSVYVIGDTQDSNLAAYKIQGTGLAYQTNYLCEEDPGTGMGAVGLAIDTASEVLFVTFEGENVIELVKAKTMEYIDTVTATGADNLAGIVLDESRSKVYTVDRKTDHLYSYTWYPTTKTLVCDFDAPYYVQLEDISQQPDEGAYGLALDEQNHRLYVADNTTRVKYYNTNNWSHDPNDYITVSHNAVGIAIDLDNGFVYTGSGFSGTLLSKYNLSAEPNTAETTVDVNSPVVGIAVDQETGLVYLTTYETGDPNSQDRLLIYNSNLQKQAWDSNDIGNPAGVAVSDGDVEYKPPFATLTFDKVDDINDANCVLPGDDITYTITYDANGTAVYGVNIVDYLPREVDINGIYPLGVYDSLRHTVTWTIDYLPPGEANIVTLSVIVNDLADLNRAITNCCEIESDQYYGPPVCVDTNVCCWPLDIIYVDANASGDNTGASWQNAYTDLHFALNRARFCGANEIWVAAGTYYPTVPEGDEATFELVDGVPLYGGFAGNETSLNQRNWMLNDTTLAGDGDVRNVVTASDINEAIIDGFIITMGTNAGISSDGSSLTSRHNRIRENNWYGIECDDSNSNISNCLIENNCDGVYCHNSSSVTIRTCEIRNNYDWGISCESISTALIENNWIHHNSWDGIYFDSAVSEPLVRNNTIVYNGDAGIATDLPEANITNCIIWGNDDGSLEGTFGDVTYSCIEGGYSGDGNIEPDAPGFVNDPNDPNNYHLAPDSPCVDTGDPNDPNDPNATDIDGEDRVIDGDANGTRIIDMGADEYYWSPADFNRNEKVDFVDYAMFANAWRTTPNDINDYNDIFDLADNNAIDYNDLALFCEDWLWEAGWTKSFACGMGRSFVLTETLYLAAPAKQPQPKIEQPDLEEIIKWLDGLWLTDDQLRKMISEDEWHKFIQALKEQI